MKKLLVLLLLLITAPAMAGGFFAGQLDPANMAPITINGLTYYSYAGAVADEDSLTLPTVTTDYSGHGFVRVSASAAVRESCEFEVGSDGTVSLIRGTANVVVGASCANAKVCISTAGTQNPVIIQVRDGAGKLEVEFWYK